LGSCAGYYAAEYLRQNNLLVEGTQVRVTAEKAKNPARLDNFFIAVNVPVQLEERHQAGMERAIHKCIVHNTLTHPPQIGLSINDAVRLEKAA
jgi:putative redox protein